MVKSSLSANTNKTLRLQICNQRRRIWFVSGLTVLLSLIAFSLSYLNPAIRAPLRPGLDFTGGTQIQLERNCINSCSEIKVSSIQDALSNLSFKEDKSKLAPNLSRVRVQSLDKGKSLVIRMPFLSASQSMKVIEAVEPIAGPFQNGGQAVDTIGPSLGKILLRSSLVSLAVAFAGIAIYISIRYDRRYALLALISLSHDVIIVCGVFSWLGLIINLEVDSLFAVSLLTIAGYSVNDTVVVFDRIRERSRLDSRLAFSEQIDRAVSATLTRTLYTSGTTLLPLFALIFFGGITLYWFAIALALGVVVGSWSSIALAPSLLSLWIKQTKNEALKVDPISSSEKEI